MEDKVRSGATEDRFTGAIESQTSKIPSSGYLAAAFGAISASAILKLVGKDDWALFVGQWLRKQCIRIQPSLTVRRAASNSASQLRERSS